eukprot:tig00020816_g14202.t1
MCALRSNAARPLQQHVEWCARVNEEFYRQGDEERGIGLPVSQFCDRTSGSAAATSAGFASFIAVPLFQAWASRFPAAQTLVEDALSSIAFAAGATLKRRSIFFPNDGVNEASEQLLSG